MRGMRIYTKFGDKGKTSLVGKVTDKDDPRVAAYGEVDELNAAIGLTIAFCKYSDIKEILTPIQKDLFIVGADLANPQGEKLNRINPIRVSEFEKTIDEIWEQLPALTHFILPGGTQTASLLHLARTICRRAERNIVALSKKEKVNPDIIVYINRLSDLLFTLARFANRKERVEEIIWKGKK